MRRRAASPGRAAAAAKVPAVLREISPPPPTAAEELDTTVVDGAWYNGIIERDLVPDFLLRAGIRRLCAARLAEQEAGGVEAQSRRFDEFVQQLRQSRIAIHTRAANEQHYEVPAAFFATVLGRQLKYSCCLFDLDRTPRSHASAYLDDAETAMLALTCERARLDDGLAILELGCGWGSLSLFMAERFPRARITAVSNSSSQKRHIDEQARQRGLRNLTIITADVNEFTTTERFDRIVSIEMFEHMRNYQTLLHRVRSWAKPGALLFVHIFAHQRFAYPYDIVDAGDWMARHFFSGGIMPSRDLLLHFQDDFVLERRWLVDGRHYELTSEAWLQRLDAQRATVWRFFEQTYGAGEGTRWLVRWRIFFMACAELFAYGGGGEWGVTHMLFRARS